MFEASDNPFAIRPQGRYRPLVVSLKGLLVVAALLIVVLVAQSQTRQWLLGRWVAGMSELPAEQQIERLKQIHALGDLATETLSRQIAAADPTVAATAYELVRERQSAWSLRDDEALSLAHRRMLTGLEVIVDELPPDRLSWVTELINQTIIECVDQRGASMNQTYAAANALASRLGPNGSAVSKSSLADADSDSLPPPSLVPLPVRMQSLSDETAARPSPTHRKSQSIAEDQQLPVLVARPGAEPVAVSAPEISALGTQHLTTSAPATARTQPAARPAATRTQRWQGAAEAATTGTLAAAGTQQAVHRVATEEPQQPSAGTPQAAPLDVASERPMRTLSTKGVIALLASKQAVTADQAVQELTRRGLGKEEIRIASQLAAPQTEVRLGLLESIVRRTDIDPRPWLLWLAEDSDRDVRLQAVAALASMDDAAVKQTLRKRLDVEADPAVAAQIRNLVGRR